MANNSIKHFEQSQIKHNKKKDDLWIKLILYNYEIYIFKMY